MSCKACSSLGQMVINCPNNQTPTAPMQFHTKLTDQDLLLIGELFFTDQNGKPIIPEPEDIIQFGKNLLLNARINRITEDQLQDLKRFDFVKLAGLPMSRDGKYRYFGIPLDKIVWFDTMHEAIDQAMEMGIKV